MSQSDKIEKDKKVKDRLVSPGYVIASDSSSDLTYKRENLNPFETHNIDNDGIDSNFTDSIGSSDGGSSGDGGD